MSLMMDWEREGWVISSYVLGGLGRSGLLQIKGGFTIRDSNNSFLKTYLTSMSLGT